ncbi:uncharacterized protein LOC143181443 [Calliopsis andreniformis]|uniref:uncharacterized protein LOC143181443 n=1 Tax=Calliopsis andreniformis TaxID=337506 RepID=UPI003FCCD926
MANYSIGGGYIRGHVSKKFERSYVTKYVQIAEVIDIVSRDYVHVVFKRFRNWSFDFETEFDFEFRASSRVSMYRQLQCLNQVHSVKDISRELLYEYERDSLLGRLKGFLLKNDDATSHECRTDEILLGHELAVLCLLLLLGLGHCQDNDLPSSMEIESSINRTIEEVERQIREDSSLPQLTRQDIVRILQNITFQDLGSIKDKEAIEKARKLYQRTLMVVLPYNAEESPENLNDLYTKPPMTQIIPDHLRDNKVNKDETRGDSENMVSTRIAHKVNLKESQSTMRSQYKNHRETYSDIQTKVPLKETLKLDSSPLKFTFNLENLQRNALTTERTTTTTRYPVYRNNGNKELEIVYSTSVTQQSTTKTAPKEITIDLGKNEQNVLTSSQWRYNPPPSTSKPTVPSKLDKLPFLPTINAETEDQLTVFSPQGLEMGPKDTKPGAMNSERPTFYVTPMPTETSSKAKYSSTYSLNSAGFRSATTTTATTSMRQEVMDLLASIGLKPDNNSNVEDVYKKNKDILASKFQVPGSNGVSGTLAGLASFEPDAASIVKQNTFEGSGSQIKKGVENLTPDVQLLFQRFGLQPSKLDESTSTTEKTTINLNSYTNFKPLPTSAVKDQEMKEFLARFGLGISDNRKQKSMQAVTKAPSVIEAVPGNMRGILENLGLISSSRKKSKVEKKAQDTEPVETSKFHVFKPHEVNVDDERQRNKINELLDTVKMVQEGKADIQNVRKVATDLLQTTKTLKDGPDPLKLEEIIRTYNEDVKNEIKRQEEEATTPGSVEETTLASTATTESTESTETATDSRNAASDLDSPTTPAPEVSSSTPSTTTVNLMALEESFGGTSEPETPPPPKRKSGLYFLVDWNTFLEVGDEGQEKINLRFQPKVGDRTRFLPVTVP